MYKSIVKLNIPRFVRNYSTRSQSYVHRVGTTPLVYRNLGQHLKIAAEKFGDREALVACQEKTRISFSEALVHADRIASGLLDLGLKPNDHLALWAPNTMQWYLTMLAAGRAGLTVVGLNPALQAPEVSYCLQKVKAKSLVTQESFKTQNFHKILSSIIPEMENDKRIKSESFPHLETIVVNSETDLPGAHKFSDLFSSAKRNLTATVNRIQPDDPCNIQFTSGTTGQPKATVLTHFNFINNSRIFGSRAGLNKGPERILCQVPFFHVYGMVAIISSMAYGATLVVPSPSFNGEESIRAIERERCSVVLGTPTMYVELLSQQKKLKLDVGSLRLAVVGGAAASPQLMRDTKRTLGLEEMQVAYGLSEATAGIFQHEGHESEDERLDTVGSLYEHLEAKVVDKDGAVVPLGQAGELCVRGFCTMREYFEDGVKTKETLGCDGWLKTGDEFILEPNGVGKVVGRKKDIILRGGECIFPKEIEDFLDTHPDILESQVVGVPDERMGEEICAFLRIREGRNSLAEADLKKFCTGQIAHFKIPRYVRIVAEFPKTTSGKIQKFKLRDIFRETTIEKL